MSAFRLRHALAMIALLSGSHASAAPGKPAAAEIKIIQTALARHQVPGASIAIIEGHQLLWAAGFGVRRQGSPDAVDDSTVFQAASVSKPMTALAVMVLADRHLLKMDDDVNLALQSWQVPTSRATGRRAVTLRRLLSHSAGISVHGFAGYAAGDPIPNLLDILKGRPPANSAPILIEKPPGQSFQYSGGGYCIIQQLLLDLQKQPFQDIMKALVLTPCGMNHSSFAEPLTGPLTANQAAGHDTDGRPIAGNAHIYPEQAAAGLWTTAADYAYLLLAIDRALAGAPLQVFSKSMIEEMTTAQKGGYGLGWGLGNFNGNATLSHGGVNEGFQCNVWLCPALGKGLIVFTNSDSGTDLINEITDPLLSGKLR